MNVLFNVGATSRSRPGNRIAVVWLLLLIPAAVLACSFATAETDPRLKEFAKPKRQQTEELAGKLHLDVPAEGRDFFRAAERGDWQSVSNSFERIRPCGGTNGPVTGLGNVLFVPIHETLGAYATFRDWDRTMLQKFADGVLDSIPAGSVFWGGTDAGRFIITAIRDVAMTPDVFVTTPKYLVTPIRPPWIYNVTQNAVVDSLYLEYLRLVYGGQLWIHSATELQNAFQKYVTDMQSRGLQTGESLSTNQDGSVRISGVGGVMGINAMVTKMIFDHNKDKHEFYVEESFVIPWMYPHLEPHGLIMKLNKEPLTALDQKIVAQDSQYWNALTEELRGDSHFTDNAPARKAFAKLRSAIGGLYSYRHMTNEAEAAFKQAVELCPTSPEANFRLAQLYVEANRFDDAVKVLQDLHKLEPQEVDRQKIQDAIDQIKHMKQEATAAKNP